MLDSDAQLYEGEVALLALLVCGIALAWLARGVRRRRPDLNLGFVIAVAFAVRGLVALSFPFLGSLGEELRGDDDSLFFNQANRLAETSLSDGLWPDTLTGELNVTIFALQLKLLGGPGGTSLRIVQAALAVAAIALVALAVRELADKRAALAAAWFLALEPSSVLFTSILHKESLILLGEGLVVLGLARSWVRRDLGGVPLAAAGVLLAFLTRSYAGGFLLLATVLVYAHLLASGLGPERRRHPRFALALVGGAALGLAGAAMSDSLLRQLDGLQQTDFGINNNLQLSPVDFSTVGGILSGLPGRLFDFVFRPFPWQAENVSQALGVFTTLLTYGLYVLLAIGLRRGGRDAARRVAPFLWLAGCLVICYALSTANAGTGFRHRIHLFVPLVGAVSILFAAQLEPVFRRLSAKLPLAACIAALALTLGACSGGDEEPAEPRPQIDLIGPDTARAATERFLHRVQDRALPLALAQYEPSVRSRLGLERFAAITEFGHYSLTGYEPRVTKVTGDGRRAEALVQARGLYDREGPFRFVLIRRDGRWRIVYDRITDISAVRHTRLVVQNRIDPGEEAGPEARRAGSRVARRYRDAAAAVLGGPVP